MTAIYICDDEAVILKEIEQQIRRKLIIDNFDMAIMAACTSARELLDILRTSKTRNSIYFLDVDLKDEVYDGFLLGKEIRRMDPNGIIVYITSFQDLAYKTFQYHIEAFDYIVKDAGRLADSIGICLSEIEEKLRHESKADTTVMVTIKAGESLRHLDVQDIYFFETAPRSHHVIVHTKQGRIDFAGNLNEIEQQLNDSFMRIHRSYIVSLKEIREVNLKQNYVIIGKQKCLVSRKAKSKLLDYLNRS